MLMHHSTVLYLTIATLLVLHSTKQNRSSIRPGTVHPCLQRDIKTSNVFLCTGGHVQLGDFGLASVSGGIGVGSLTSLSCIQVNAFSKEEPSPVHPAKDWGLLWGSQHAPHVGFRVHILYASL
jgi:serine/threonine protein kinase